MFTATPASESLWTNAQESRAEPNPSIDKTVCTPRSAQLHKQPASAMPTLSSSRMKVSTATKRRAWAMASKTRGKNSSPFSSNRPALPCVQAQPFVPGWPMLIRGA
jgi:hypothetical protein